jgi:NAD(P)-dependent dehydrogenase (short-subunit alcohol dehydrogenase family)
MKHDFKNKVVVITAEVDGVGRVMAEEFAKQGAKIASLTRGLNNWKQEKRSKRFGRRSIINYL